MAQYADMKSKRLKKALRKLANKGKLDFTDDGRHASITSPMGHKYPIPLSHRITNKFIVKELVDFLIAHNICTKQEFDDLL